MIMVFFLTSTVSRGQKMDCHYYHIENPTAIEQAKFDKKVNYFFPVLLLPSRELKMGDCCGFRCPDKDSMLVENENTLHHSPVPEGTECR
jgi:hypothetical protein